MNYILKEYLAAFPFYFIASMLMAEFAPWITQPFWPATFSIVLGAYLWLTVWIVARTIWLTYKNRKARRNNG